MNRLFSLICILLFLGCSTLNNKPNYIPYRFPKNIENILVEEIKKNPNLKYCLLIEENDETYSIGLVQTYSYFHENTSYMVPLGDRVYPVSFLDFDLKFGVTENLDEFLKRKKLSDRNDSDLLTKFRYPMYHNVFWVHFKNRNEVISYGYEF